VAQKNGFGSDVAGKVRCDSQGHGLTHGGAFPAGKAEKTNNSMASQLNARKFSCGTRRSKMLETIVVILVVLWLLGFVTSHTMGGLIHVLLVVAVVVVLLRIIQGRRL